MVKHNDATMAKNVAASFGKWVLRPNFALYIRRTTGGNSKKENRQGRRKAPGVVTGLILG
jgi:hypothetical protein